MASKTDKTWGEPRKTAHLGAQGTSIWSPFKKNTTSKDELPAFGEGNGKGEKAMKTLHKNTPPRPVEPKLTDPCRHIFPKLPKRTPISFSKGIEYNTTLGKKRNDNVNKLVLRHFLMRGVTKMQDPKPCNS